MIGQIPWSYGLVTWFILLATSEPTSSTMALGVTTIFVTIGKFQTPNWRTFYLLSYGLLF
jgi:hypothetical protein